MTPDEITELRVSLGLTQLEFAHIIGTTPVSVNRWEMGHVKPSRLSLKEIKELKANHGSYICRRKKLKHS